MIFSPFCWYSLPMRTCTL